MKKIEIVISNLFLRKFIESLEQVPINGFTILDVIDSQGPNEGRIFDSGLVPVQNKSLVFMIIEDQQLESVKAVLRPFVEEFKGFATISNIEVLTY